MKLSEIINTDCYIQFDSNEQLREWVEEAGLKVRGKIFDREKFVGISSDEYSVLSLVEPNVGKPIHHHTNISI